MVQYADPETTLQDIIRDLQNAESDNEVLGRERLTHLRETLEIVRGQIASLSSDSLYRQTGIITGMDNDDRSATVAGDGGMRYEVRLSRSLPAQEPGQSTTIAPGFLVHQKTLRYKRQYLGEVGPVGQVARVLRNESGLARLQLCEGLVVEATENLTSSASLKPGDRVRYDPNRLLALEVIEAGEERRDGPVGLVTSITEGVPLRLQIVYGAGESFTVEPSEELAREGVKVGDQVNFDAATRIASRKSETASDARGRVGEVVDVYTSWHEGGHRTRRLHVRSGGGEGVLVGLGPQVENEEFTAGDLVRVDLRALLVLERLKTYDLTDVRPEEIGETPFEKIGGLKQAVEDIRTTIEWPYLYPNVYRTYELRGTKGILLYGPPGCGKTLIAKAIASNLRAQIAGELNRPEVQAHLEQLIRALGIHKALLKLNPDLTRLSQNWCELIAQLPESARRQPHEWLEEPHEGWTKEALHQQVKAFLLAHDVANLDTPNAEIGKLHELSDRDPDGSHKDPQPQAFFINVSGPELLTKWVGETEHKIRKLFEKARRASGPYTPVIVFLDEIESMFQTRGSGISSDVEKTVVPQFLSELDGVRELRNVLVIGASNRVELIDPALLRPGRLDRKIKIDRPDRDAAVDVLLKYLVPELPLDGDASQLAHQLVEVLYDERSYVQVTNKRGERLIVSARQSVSGAILESVVTRAKKSAAESWIKRFGKAKPRPEGPPTGEIGLVTFSGLLDALKQEYEENKDHFALNFLESQTTDRRRRPSIEDLTVTVRWAAEVTDRWQDQAPDLFRPAE